MPHCTSCNRVLATAELRRLPSGGYRCKDRHGCYVARKTREDETECPLCHTQQRDMQRIPGGWKHKCEALA